jgi:DNA-binding winged helix-turn-helix (wHTH) protein
MWTGLQGLADRATLTTAWRDALTCLRDDRPDLVIIERSALTDIGTEERAALAEDGHWPPVVLVDNATSAPTNPGVLVDRLVRISSPLFQVGELQIDMRKKRAGLAGRWVSLPPLEFRLLLALARHAGEVVGYRELLQAVWGYDAGENEARELLKVHIRHIRQRLGLNERPHTYIRSVRGFGYMLAAPEDE